MAKRKLKLGFSNRDDCVIISKPPKWKGKPSRRKKRHVCLLTQCIKLPKELGGKLVKIRDSSAHGVDILSTLAKLSPDQRDYVLNHMGG